MNGSFLLRLKLIGLVVFLLGGGISLGYALLYQWPKQECESKGGWYTFKYRKCAYPVYLPTLTGRKPGEPRKVIWPGDKPAKPLNTLPADPVKPVAPKSVAPKSAAPQPVAS